MRHLSTHKEHMSLRDQWQVAAEFYDAASTGMFAVLEKLLEEEKNPDIKDKMEITPLWIVAFRGHEQVVGILAHRADFNVDTESVMGKSTIFWQSCYGYERIVGILMEAGANPHLVDENGNMLVTTASKYGHESIAQMLEGRSMSGLRDTKPRVDR
jgi:ankyrin repeat protein